MSRCSDIKFQGYFVGTLWGLELLLGLLLSLYYSFSESSVPEALKDFVAVSVGEYVGITIGAIVIALLFYGIVKENHLVLIPFTTVGCLVCISLLFLFDSSNLTKSLLQIGCGLGYVICCLFVVIRLYLQFKESAKINLANNRV